VAESPRPAFRSNIVQSRSSTSQSYFGLRDDDDPSCLPGSSSSVLEGKLKDRERYATTQPRMGATAVGEAAGTAPTGAQPTPRPVMRARSVRPKQMNATHANGTHDAICLPGSKPRMLAFPARATMWANTKSRSGSRP
jgi:hypothetical protein